MKSIFRLPGHFNAKAEEQILARFFRTFKKLKLKPDRLNINRSSTKKRFALKQEKHFSAAETF